MEFASINFESLDSLMADLGNMITASPGQKNVAAASLSPSLAAQSGARKEDTLAVSGAGSQATEDYIQSARRSFGGNPLLEALKGQHEQELTLLRDAHQQRDARAQEEQRNLVAKYEQRIMEIEAQLSEANARSQNTKNQEEYTNLSGHNEKLTQRVAALEVGTCSFFLSFFYLFYPPFLNCISANNSKETERRRSSPGFCRLKLGRSGRRGPTPRPRCCRFRRRMLT